MRAAILAAALALAGCAEYLPMAQIHAGTSATAQTAILPAAHISSELCRTRADLDRMASRLDGTAPWGSEPTWSHFYDRRVTDDKGSTWSAYCQRLAANDDQARAAMQLLADYGNILVMLAGGGYQGGALYDTASAIASGGGAFAPSLAGANALGQPLTQMANYVFKEIEKHIFVSAVHDGDPLYAAVIKGLDEWLGAIDAEANAAQHKLGQVLDAIDRGTKDPPPLAAAGLLDFGDRSERTLRRWRETIAAHRRILAKLAESHHALAEAAAAGKSKDRDAALQRVALACRQANEEIARLRETALQEGAE